MNNQVIGTVEFSDGTTVEIFNEDGRYLFGDGFQLKKARHPMKRVEPEEKKKETENPVRKEPAKKTKAKGEKKA